MRMFVGIAALLLLTGCDREAETAEQEFDLVSSSKLSSQGEKCIAARKAADAWLKRQNKDRYEFWSLSVATYC